MATIEIANVWKRFSMSAGRPRTLKEALAQAFVPGRRPAANEQSFWALQDISLAIEQGETFGIIGSNGSGKSTLLKLMTGISKPTRGGIGVRGRVSALLELGAGFHPDFSGRENTYLNGAILGLSRKAIDGLFDRIVDFSELGAFIDNPVKTYSSGMYMRLAFAIAIHVDPDVLIVDEVLAVGDAAFQQKCFDQIQRFKHAGKTIVLVSHSPGQVAELCQRAAWIEKGHLYAVGKTSDVLERYGQQVSSRIEQQKSRVEEASPANSASIHNLLAFDTVTGEQGLLEYGHPTRVMFDVTSSRPLEDLDVLVQIFRADRTCCLDAHQDLASMGANGLSGRISFDLPSLKLNHSAYTLQVSLVSRSTYVPLDEKYYNFSVNSVHRGPGIAPLEAEWQWLEAPVPSA